MSYPLKIAVQEIAPEKRGVLELLGINQDYQPSQKIDTLYEEGSDLLSQLAKPRELLKKVTKKNFKDIFEGEGLNDTGTVVKRIYEEADNLALWVFTLGRPVSDKINQLFKTKNYPLAAMVDALASDSVIRATKRAEEIFTWSLKKDEKGADPAACLLYSPGYCGWHISGQKKLFNVLQPEKIDIHLNQSYLMAPLKSVSGVLLAGGKKIHVFNNNFPYCNSCVSKSCRDRIQSL